VQHCPCWLLGAVRLSRATRSPGRTAGLDFWILVDGSDNRLGKFLFQIIEATAAECRRVMAIDLHEMMGRGDLEPKTSSYARRPPFVERRVSRIR
jgi:hypothetical protein